MKFVIYFDYSAESRKQYEYMAMEAKDLETAIAEADEKIKANEEPIYLTRIMKKVGKIEKDSCGIKYEHFEAVLCRRSCGWHINNRQNYENEHFAKRTYTKDWDFYEAEYKRA